MRTIRSGDIGLGDARERIQRMVRGHTDRVMQVLQKHGAVIEVKAAAITPVDKGFLRRANTVKTEKQGSACVLTAENRMIYAVWQHNFEHNHKQPSARDHFIAIPFGRELPMIVSDIIDKDMEAAT